MPDSSLVTPASYARSRKLSRSTIAEQIARGLPIVEVDGDRLIDPVEADEWRTKHLSTRRGGRRDGKPTLPLAAPTPTPPTPAEAALIDAAIADPARFLRETPIGEAERIRACAKALIELRAVERQSAEWITVTDAGAIFSDYLTGLRSRLLAIPGTAAPTANADSPAVAERAIYREIVNAMADLSAGAMTADAAKLRTARDGKAEARRRSRGATR